MKALVVYESMFGNTREVAERIARGLGNTYEVTVSSVDEATPAELTGLDLLVVGGPTHTHGMTSSMSRTAALEQVDQDPELNPDPHVSDSGLREWLADLPKHSRLRAAAFDTRADGPAALTGRASKSIGRRLQHHGCDLIVDPESFLVDKANRLLLPELTRAQRWGERLASAET